jgi:hypothetical protein
LYLTLLWTSSNEPYDTSYPARAWADLLDLQDPEGKGARRVKDAIQRLEQEGLIRVTEQPGKPSRLFLLDETGNRKEYLPPYARESPRYLQLPASFWTKGWVVTLSAVATAVFLMMLDQVAFVDGKPSRKPFWISPKVRNDLYAISEDSWTKGCQELASHRLITIARQSVAASSFGFMRFRNTYRVHPDRLSRLPPKTS